MKDGNLEEEYETRPIPSMTFRKNVPKLPGQDTQQFKNWPWKIQANQKVLHLEVDKGEKTPQQWKSNVSLMSPKIHKLSFKYDSRRNGGNYRL